jgi:hypothetical protein
MKKVIIAGLISVASIGHAQAWGDREQAALAGIAGTLLIQQMTRPNVIAQPPVTVGAPVTVIQPLPVYSYPPAPVYYRSPPVYSQQYSVPSRGMSCVPAYDQFGSYLGCIR